MPGRTQVTTRECNAFRVRGSYPVLPAVPSCSAKRCFCNSPIALRHDHVVPTTPTKLSPQAWHLIGLGWSLFARHYSGSRFFFLFLRLLRCVTSPACLPLPYVFRQGYARITTHGFPHSEIRGSKVVQHLTAAYRSRPRPSSAPGAKASTACPSYLDEEHTFATMQFSRYVAGNSNARLATAPTGIGHPQD